jgi:hypothetical protein
MSSAIAILIVVGALGMLIGYQLGYSAGQKVGYDRGHNDGKHAGSVRAFAVGYDRGRHDREVKQPDESADKPAARFGGPPLLGLVLLTGCLLALLLIMRGNGVDFGQLWSR